MAMVGQRVRAARADRSMSRRLLSVVSGVSQRYIAQLEAGEGNASLLILSRIAGALGTPIETLLREEPVERDGELATLIADIRAASPQQLSEVRALIGGAGDRGARVALIGLRGAGKSTLGPLAAEALGAPFVELTQEIETLGGMATPDLIALYGQEGYRKLEADAVARSAEHEGPLILAAAGGIVSEPRTFAMLLRRFHTIWLRAAPEEHMARVRAQGDERPMAGDPAAMDALRSILKGREAAYARAGAVVDTSRVSADRSLSRLLAVIRDQRLLTGRG